MLHRCLSWALIPLAVSCGSTAPEGAASPAPSAGLASTSAPSAGGQLASATAGASPSDAAPEVLPEPPPPGPAPTPASKSTRDAKIVKLAKAAAACKFDEDGSVDRECPAFVQWRDEEKLFVDGQGNATILSLLEDEDPKLRQVAALRGFVKPEVFFAVRENAHRLAHAAIKETDAQVGRALGELASRIDGERVDLKGELFALTKHPIKELRSSFAFYLLGRNPSALNLAIAHRMMTLDPDVRVQETAVGSLSTGGITKGTPGVCALLRKQLRRTDRPGAQAHWTAGTSWCGEVFPALMDSLEQRVDAWVKAGARESISEYALAATAICSMRPELDPAAKAALKRRAFVVGQRITESSDRFTKGFGTRVLTDCDPVAARPILESMAKSNDSVVADEAKRSLKGLSPSP